GEHLGGARRGGKQPRLDLVQRLELHQLLLERPREAAAPEVPAVELLQEPGRPLLAELPDRLAHEHDQLRDDLLAPRRLRVALDDLPQRPRVALRRAPDHHGGRAGRRQDRPGPRRILPVTGTETASETAATTAHARSGSSSIVAPAPVFVTFLTGQPKLMSTRSAPASSTNLAASAITEGSEPKICTARGRS